MKKTILRNIGFVLFLLGLFSFAFIGLVSIWGDIEASFFNASLMSAEKLKSLSCPPVIMKNEIGFITADFTNPTGKPIDLEIRTYVTDGFVTLMTEYISEISLSPGESQSVEWAVTAEEAAYNRLVLARVHRMKEYPLPYANAACGIVVINLPFSNGILFVIMIMGFAVLLSAFGIVLWALHSKPIVWRRMKIFKAMIILAVTSLFLALSGLLSLWGLGILLTVVWVLMGIGMLWQFTAGPKKKDLESPR
jgi:hypothetical protein